LRETVALFNREAAGFVHFGCTNRDLVDTALALVARNVLDLIEADLAQIIGSLLALAGRHAGDATLARSPSSNPSVTSFGLICCQWAAPLVRSQQRLQSGACHGLSLHLGSTTSTLADVQDSDTLVVALMASELELKAPVFSGHVTGDETVALACELGLLVGNLGKIASDMAYLVACAAGELTLYGSCAVPSSGTKPLTSEPISTGCMVALAGAQRVPQQVAVMLASLSQGHGNALGSWHAQLAQWPALLATSQSVTRAMAQIMVGLQVDTRRMRSNLDVVRTCVNGKEAKIRLSADWAAQAVAMTDRQIHTLLAPQKPT
jgi:3-carboxy-cis,cis-muconate cycloisomerase